MISTPSHYRCRNGRCKTLWASPRTWLRCSAKETHFLRLGLFSQLIVQEIGHTRLAYQPKLQPCIDFGWRNVIDQTTDPPFFAWKERTHDTTQAQRQDALYFRPRWALVSSEAAMGPKDCPSESHHGTLAGRAAEWRTRWGARADGVRPYTPSHQELFGVAALFGGGGGQFTEETVFFIIGASGEEQFRCQAGTTCVRPEAESPQAINDDRVSIQV